MKVKKRKRIKKRSKKEMKIKNIIKLLTSNKNDENSKIPPVLLHSKPKMLKKLFLTSLTKLIIKLIQNFN